MGKLTPGILFMFQVIFFLSFIAVIIADSKKITKRGVLSEEHGHSDSNLDLPLAHRAGHTIPLEAEAPVDEHDAHGSSGFDVSSVNSAVHVGSYIDLGRVIQQHVHVVRKVGIPIPQPFPVPVERKVPFEVHHPVDVPVERPYKVPVPVDVPVKIFKDIPVHVERKVPVLVKVPVKIPVKVPYKVYHTKPVPVPIWKKVPIPVPKPVFVKKPVPVAIHVHSHLEPLHDHHEHHHSHHHADHESW